MFTFITPEQKREKIIMNASLATYQQKPNAFREIDYVINNKIENVSQSKKQSILLKWLKSCEKLNATSVKTHIIVTFTK